MYSGINQIQSPDDDQQTFFSYYNHNEKSPDFVCRKRKPAAPDRHSKVRTARGPRDRRLRLSPTTAIQFYDVQDRLGYDRPSKAIDWLIREAKTAIDALRHHPNAAPPTRIDDIPGSGFGFCADGAPEFQAYLDQDFNAASQILELQKMLTWNCENENSGNTRDGNRGGAEYATVDSSEPISGNEREPLQSINTEFREFSFYNELSNITASAILKKEDDKDNMASSSSAFLHYED